MTYTEGWPKKWRIARVEIDDHGAVEDEIAGQLDPGESVVVVPLSDAERLREERDEAEQAAMLADEHAERLQEALERISKHPVRVPGDCNHMKDIARAALDREGEWKCSVCGSNNPRERREVPATGTGPREHRGYVPCSHSWHLDREGEWKCDCCGETHPDSVQVCPKWEQEHPGESIPMAALDREGEVPDSPKIRAEIIEQLDREGKEYPRQDGDFTVIGPECFASEDGSVISWRGENYVRQAALDREGEDG
jgi:rubrerythrin